MSRTVMLVDDDIESCGLLRRILAKERYEIVEKGSAAELKSSLAGFAPAVILLDLSLPDGHGLELLPLVTKSWPTAPVIILTGQASLGSAVSATKLGAFDFKTKPFSVNDLLGSVHNACSHHKRSEEVKISQQTAMEGNRGIPPIFNSPAIKAAVRMAERVAASDVSVLITGESGTGKEVMADLIHARSERCKGPFVKINCAAMPRELIESELFGSIKGSFTGAQADRIGLFAQAEKGTLLLDELAEMPIYTQSKLLRVLPKQESPGL